MKLTGRVLHLLTDAQAIRRQLDGADLSATDLEGPYSYGVNTDAMISGRACTFGYTPEIPGPYFLPHFPAPVP